MTSRIIPFSNPNNYSYDPTEIEIAGGVAQMIPRPLGGTFYASYDANANADWSLGNGTASLNGLAAVLGGLLRLNYANTWAQYAGAGNTDMVNTGTLRADFVPRYDGSPAADGALFSLRQSAAVDNNSIVLRHATGGQWLLVAKDSIGAGTSFGLGGVWAAVSGQTYEIELCWDMAATGNKWWLFIDGVLWGASASYRARANTVAQFYIGANKSGLWDDPCFDVGQVMVSGNCLHKDDYTPGWGDVGVTRYIPGGARIAYTCPVCVTQVFSIDETATKPAGTEIYYSFHRVNNGWLYHDGTAWVEGTGAMPDASTAAEVNSEAAGLVFNRDPLDAVRIWLSGDGTNTPVLDQLQVYYASLIGGNAVLRGPNRRYHRGRPWRIW